MKNMMKEHSRRYPPSATTKKRLTMIHTIYTYPNPLKLAFVRHIDSMDPRCVILKVHETVEHELRAFIIREWAVLARLKQMMPVKVALQ